MRAAEGLFQKAYRHKWLILLCLASLALRLYKLDAIPYGLGWDEAGSAYDAWCIANYGVDRYGMSYPLFFINYGGGGQSPLFLYLCALSIKLFGMNAFAIRLPMVLSSMMALFCGLKITQRVWKDEKALLLFAGLFLVIPYFLTAARTGLDCNLMLGFSTLFLFLFFKATQSGRLRDYALSGIAGGLTLCTYTLSYIVLPFFLLLMLVALVSLHKLYFKQILCFGAGLLPLALPLLAMVVVNQFHLETLTVGPFTIPRLNGYRVGELALPSLQRLLETLQNAYMMNNAFFQSSSFYWTLLSFSPVLAVLGLVITVVRSVKSLRTHIFTMETVIIGWFLSMLFLGSMLDCGAESHRLNGIYSMVLYFMATGAYQLIRFAAGLVARPARWAATTLCIACAGCYVCFAGAYLSAYFSLDKVDLAGNSPVPQDVFDYIAQDDTFVDRDIYYYSNSQHSYIYYLLATLPNPMELFLEADEDGHISQIGNVHCGLLDGIDDNAVYVLRLNNGYWETMMEWGFSEIEFDDHILYYVE